MWRHVSKVVFWAACLAICRQASAEVIGNPDALGNIDGLGIGGWNNVGQMNGASGVYIGNGWVLTVAHELTPQGILFDFSPTPYLPDSTPIYYLTNPDGSYADLQLFHLQSTPPLPNLKIAYSSPGVGALTTSIGYGLTNVGGVQYYDSSFNTVAADDPTVAYGGYGEGNQYIKRWATNYTLPVDSQGDYNASGSALAPISGVYANDTSEDFFAQFYTGISGVNSYDAGGNGSSEGQIAGGDSGGAVFDSSGYLIGINEAEGLYPGQDPSKELALFGNMSAYVDVPYYRDQIVADAGLPEPCGISLVAICAGWGLTRRRRAVFASSGRAHSR
jgi:hypothetical protein